MNKFSQMKHIPVNGMELEGRKKKRVMFVRWKVEKDDDSGLPFHSSKLLLKEIYFLLLEAFPLLRIVSSFD